jgi:cation diffusion facilitator family transporter
MNDHHHGLLGRLRQVIRAHSHDHAEVVDAALASRQGIRAVKISLLLLGLTGLAQLGLVLVTGSVALLADTIHNLSDALTAVPLWIAFALGRRRPSRRYTYGLGRVEDLCGVFIVVMIALSAALAGYESVRRLIDPQPLSHAWVVVVAGVVGFLGNELVAGYRIRVGRQIGSAALVADGLHARTDGFTSLAVVLGAVGVASGFPLADPLVGLAISLAILFVLKGAAVDVYRRLMDAVEPDTVDHTRDIVTATPGVETVESLRLRWIGHALRAEIDVAVDPGLSIVEAHGISIDVHRRLLHGMPRLTDATVHVSPSGPEGERQHALLHEHGASRAIE